MNCLLRLQDVENNFFKNLSNSIWFKDLLRAQCEEIREAKIGLNIMLSEAEIWLETFFPSNVREGVSVCYYILQGDLSIVKLKTSF